MAIYTKISKNDVVSIEKKFNLGKIIYFKGIKKGIENTNYLLKTKNKKFILTIFEKRVQKKMLYLLKKNLVLEKLFYLKELKKVLKILITYWKQEAKNTS